MARREPASSQYLLLDTHILLWLASDNQRLPSRISNLLQEALLENRLAASVISAWEVGVLCSKNRLELNRSPIAWFDELIHSFRINLMELTTEIAINSSFLPRGVHADPADRILIATAKVIDASLVTADARILKYAKSGHVKCISAL